jgi:hypothetical protein
VLEQDDARRFRGVHDGEGVDSHTEGVDSHTEGVDSHTEGVDSHTLCVSKTMRAVSEVCTMEREAARHGSPHATCKELLGFRVLGV